MVCYTARAGKWKSNISKIWWSHSEKWWEEPRASLARKREKLVFWVLAFQLSRRPGVYEKTNFSSSPEECWEPVRVKPASPETWAAGRSQNPDLEVGRAQDLWRGYRKCLRGEYLIHLAPARLNNQVSTWTPLRVDDLFLKASLYHDDHCTDWGCWTHIRHSA